MESKGRQLKSWLEEGMGKALALFHLSLLLGGCNFAAPSAPNAATALEDQTVTILGSLTGNGEEKLMAALAPFTEATGIEVAYEGSDAFATLVSVRAEAGNMPDVALFPQPGLMLDLAKQGYLQPQERDLMAELYNDYWLELATVDGELYGVWMRADVKSLVWYNPAVFSAAGYTVPNSWDALERLMAQMVADGHTPWCMGLESGDATGWVGTDWVEDLLLRQAEPELYDQWVNHEIPFDHPAVEQALETFGQIARDASLVRGGATGVISTSFGDSPGELFTEPPGCYLHRQASFISDFLPEEAKPGETVDVFVLPPMKSQQDAPVLVGGVVFAQFNETPAARLLMEYLATVEAHEIWAQNGYVSPHLGVTESAYLDVLKRRQAEILREAGVIRFDGSDLMPGEVGTGSFWMGVVDYVGGADARAVLQEIEASWPGEVE